MSRRRASFWRLFAAITFLNQIVRVPIFLFLANSVRDLEVYFVISATSIPIQFIAFDILQYRRKPHRLPPLELIALPVFASGSIVYVILHNGLIVGYSYLIFAIAILLYGASVGYLRDVFSAERVLAMDAIYNTGTTIIAVASLLLIQDGSNLGYSVIFSQAGMAVIICILNGFAIRRKRRESLPSTMVVATASIGSNSAAPLILASLMATTQLERLIIAATQPALLVCISLAAGVIQALRKVGMDDAVVFERLHHRLDKDFYQAMRSQLIHARFVFYLPLVFALVALFFINDIASWSIAHGIFRTIGYSGYVNTVVIVCVYFAAMPPGIVMINTVRLQFFALHRLGWIVILLVVLIEILAMFFSFPLSQHINLPIALIILNAGLSHIMFLALCPVKLRDSFRLLFLDIAVYIFTIVLLGTTLIRQPEYSIATNLFPFPISP